MWGCRLIAGLVCHAAYAESMAKHLKSDDPEHSPEVLPSGAVEYTARSWANDALWLSAADRERMLLGYDVHGAPPAAGDYIAAHHPALTAAGAKQQQQDAIGGIKGGNTYIPLHKARLQQARSALRSSKEQTFDRSATVAAVTQQLDRVAAELQELQNKGAKGVSAPAAGGHSRSATASQLPLAEYRGVEEVTPPRPSVHSASYITPSRAPAGPPPSRIPAAATAVTGAAQPKPPAKGLDVDFMALQRVFEDMLSRDEPPDYEDFLKKTSFLQRAPSPPRAALRAVTQGLPPFGQPKPK